jgi:toxin YoeB
MSTIGAKSIMHKVFHDHAWDDLMQLAQNDRKCFHRAQQIIRDIERDPFRGIGRPEPLKGDWSGYWSRRIDDEHRIVYRMRDGKLEIAQCRSHYGDK